MCRMSSVERSIVLGKSTFWSTTPGIGEFGKRLHETDDAIWAHVLDVNVTGVFRMTRAVIPHMLKQGRGSIINISSIASLVGLSGLAAYTASKGALDALTRALAVEYAKEGIRCNVVNPGLIDTPMAAPLMANPDMLQPILGPICDSSSWDTRRSGEYGSVSGFG